MESALQEKYPSILTDGAAPLSPNTTRITPDARVLLDCLCDLFIPSVERVRRDGFLLCDRTARRDGTVRGEEPRSFDITDAFFHKRDSWFGSYDRWPHAKGAPFRKAINHYAQLSG